MRRTYWIVVVTIIIVLVTGDVVYWRIAADRLRTGYETWLATLASEGWHCESAPLLVGGWPRAATVAIPNLQLRHRGSGVPGDLTFTSGALMLSVSLFSPESLMVTSSQPIHLRVGDMPEIVLDSGEDWMSVPLLQPQTNMVDLHVSRLRIAAATGAWQITTGLLNAHATFQKTLEVHATGTPDAPAAKTGADPTGGETRGGDEKPADTLAADQSSDHPEPLATFDVSAEAIALPATIKWPLGTNISSVSLDGELNGPMPKASSATGWAEAWRDGGGSLAITHLTMGWGPLGLTASATLALDDQLQPMGSGNGRFVGYAATLDRLAAGGMLTKSAATAAKAVLSLLAGSADGNEPSAVDVPLTLQYRTLSMRQVPLLRLPELDWPTP